MGRRRRRRSALVVTVGAFFALVFAGVALATNYWGFNYMYSTTTACSGGRTGSVCASGVTASSDQVQKNSGSACIDVFFYGGTGDVLCSNSTDTISAFASTGTDPAAKPACAWDLSSVSGTYAYIQCRYFNGFGPMGVTYG